MGAYLLLSGRAGRKTPIRFGPFPRGRLPLCARRATVDFNMALTTRSLPLGIDIGSTRIRIAQAARDEDGVILESVSVIDLEEATDAPHDERYLGARIAQALARIERTRTALRRGGRRSRRGATHRFFPADERARTPARRCVRSHALHRVSGGGSGGAQRLRRSDRKPLHLGHHAPRAHGAHLADSPHRWLALATVIDARSLRAATRVSVRGRSARHRPRSLAPLRVQRQTRAVRRILLDGGSHTFTHKR